MLSFEAEGACRRCQPGGSSASASTGSSPGGTPCTLLPVAPGSVCLGLRLGERCAGTFVDVQYGSAVPGTPVWSYAANGTVSQQWVPLVWLPATGQLLQYHAALAAAKAHASGSAAPTPASTYLTSTPHWQLLLRCAIKDTLVLGVGEGGRVGLAPATLPPPTSGACSQWQPVQWLLQRWLRWQGGRLWLNSGWRLLR